MLVAADIHTFVSLPLTYLFYVYMSSYWGFATICNDGHKARKASHLLLQLSLYVWGIFILELYTAVVSTKLKLAPPAKETRFGFLAEMYFPALAILVFFTLGMRLLLYWKVKCAELWLSAKYNARRSKHRLMPSLEKIKSDQVELALWRKKGYPVPWFYVSTWPSLKAPRLGSLNCRDQRFVKRFTKFLFERNFAESIENVNSTWKQYFSSRVAKILVEGERVTNPLFYYDNKDKLIRDWQATFRTRYHDVRAILLGLQRDAGLRRLLLVSEDLDLATWFSKGLSGDRCEERFREWCEMFEKLADSGAFSIDNAQRYGLLGFATSPNDFEFVYLFWVCALVAIKHHTDNHELWPQWRRKLESHGASAMENGDGIIISAEGRREIERIVQHITRAQEHVPNEVPYPFVPSPAEWGGSVSHAVNNAVIEVLQDEVLLGIKSILSKQRSKDKNCVVCDSNSERIESFILEGGNPQWHEWTIDTVMCGVELLLSPFGIFFCLRFLKSAWKSYGGWPRRRTTGLTVMYMMLPLVLSIAGSFASRCDRSDILRSSLAQITSQPPQMGPIGIQLNPLPGLYLFALFVLVLCFNRKLFFFMRQDGRWATTLGALLLIANTFCTSVANVPRGYNVLVQLGKFTLIIHGVLLICFVCTPYFAKQRANTIETEQPSDDTRSVDVPQNGNRDPKEAVTRTNAGCTITSLKELPVPGDRIQAEYIWLDANENLCSKGRVISAPESLPALPNPRDVQKWDCKGWIDGLQVSINLRPRAVYWDCFRKRPNILVLCEPFEYRDKTQAWPMPHNIRRELVPVAENAQRQEPWFGVEQEYFFYEPHKKFPVGFKENGEGISGPQKESSSPYYCSVGTLKIFKRDVVEAHFRACMYAGIEMSGINAEVAPGQWEYQVGPVDPIELGDMMLTSRYILNRCAEAAGLSVNYEPKPVKGNYNGSGLHANFSTKPMRDAENGYNDHIIPAIKRLEANHKRDIEYFGKGNRERLTGLHETSAYHKFTQGVANRHASVRISHGVIKKGRGYLEDRRPGGNANPYIIVLRLVGACCVDPMETQTQYSVMDRVSK